jgi:hypothetical protein
MSTLILHVTILFEVDAKIALSVFIRVHLWLILLNVHTVSSKTVMMQQLRHSKAFFFWIFFLGGKGTSVFNNIH